MGTLRVAMVVAMVATPLGVGADTLFVSDVFNTDIVRFDLPSNVPQHIAFGATMWAEDGACDPQGRIYFARGLARQVTRYEPDGTNPLDLLTAASPVGPPEGPTFDAAGNLYVNTREDIIGPGVANGVWFLAGANPAGTFTQTLPTFSTFGEGLEIVRGGPHQGALLVIDGIANQVLISEPPGAPPTLLIDSTGFPSGVVLVGVATNPAGEVFVSHSQGLSSGVERFDPDGFYIDTYATGLCLAFFLEFDSQGDLYIADNCGPIMKVTPAKVMTTFATIGSPIGVAICRSSPVLAVDFAEVTATVHPTGGVAVRWRTLREEDTSHFVVYRAARETGTEGAAEAVPFVDARGLPATYEALDPAPDAAQPFYFVEERTSAGRGTRSNRPGDGGGNERVRQRRHAPESSTLTRAAPIIAALALALAPSPAHTDTLFVSESDNSDIFRFDLPSNVAQRIVAGAANSVEDGACDPQGRVYFARGLARQITRYEPDGTNPLDLLTAASPLGPPEGPTFDAAGNLYVNTREDFIGPGLANGVWFLAGANPAGTFTQTLSTFSTWGEGLEIVRGGPHQGALLVVDAIANHVLLSEPPGAPPISLIDSTGFPSGVTLVGVVTNPAGEVFVSHSLGLSSGVVRFDPDGFFIDTYATGLCQALFLDFDSQGNLYIADNCGSIVKVTPAKVMTTFATIGGGPIGVAICRSSPVLAVDFADVTAAAHPTDGIAVRWRTLREEDTSHFVVYRTDSAAGTAGVTEAVPFVDARGLPSSYEAIDPAPDAARPYYFVEERTSAGRGARSEVVRIAAASTTAASAAGRARRRRDDRRD